MSKKKRLITLIISFALFVALTVVIICVSVKCSNTSQNIRDSGIDSENQESSIGIVEEVELDKENIYF